MHRSLALLLEFIFLLWPDYDSVRIEGRALISFWQTVSGRIKIGEEFEKLERGSKGS